MPVPRNEWINLANRHTSCICYNLLYLSDSRTPVPLYTVYISYKNSFEYFYSSSRFFDWICVESLRRSPLEPGVRTVARAPPLPFTRHKNTAAVRRENRPNGGPRWNANGPRAAAEVWPLLIIYCAFLTCRRGGEVLRHREQANIAAQRWTAAAG